MESMLGGYASSQVLPPQTHHLSAASYKQLAGAAWSEAFTFSLVRNPYARLLSVFLIMLQDDCGAAPSKQQPRADCGGPTRKDRGALDPCLQQKPPNEDGQDGEEVEEVVVEEEEEDAAEAAREGKGKGKGKGKGGGSGGGVGKGKGKGKGGGGGGGAAGANAAELDCCKFFSDDEHVLWRDGMATSAEALGPMFRRWLADRVRALEANPSYYCGAEGASANPIPRGASARPHTRTPRRRLQPSTTADQIRPNLLAAPQLTRCLRRPPMHTRRRYGERSQRVRVHHGAALHPRRLLRLRLVSGDARTSAAAPPSC